MISNSIKYIYFLNGVYRILESHSSFFYFCYKRLSNSIFFTGIRAYTHWLQVSTPTYRPTFISSHIHSHTCLYELIWKQLYLHPLTRCCLCKRPLDTLPSAYVCAIFTGKLGTRFFVCVVLLLIQIYFYASFHQVGLLRWSFYATTVCQRTHLPRFGGLTNKQWGFL